MTDIPEFYFRTRENGAAVFRLASENRQNRLEMEQIALVSIRSGEIRPHGGRVLSATEKAAIDEWVVARRAELAVREVDDIRRTVESLHRAAHWIQTRAQDAQLDELTDDLLLAMHDLRNVLVRKKSERLAARGETGEET